MYLIYDLLNLAEFIGIVVFLVFTFSLRRRVKKLEQFVKIKATQNTPETNSQLQQLETLSEKPEQSDPLAMQTAVPEQAEPELPSKFAEWLKEDWLLKLGALLLLIGFGWLTTYAFLNNWIGPMGRIALGIIAGSLFILLGWWRIKNYIHQGGVFLVLGSTTILLTVFAARGIYGFFTPLSALFVMFLSTAFVALASVKYNNPTLSLASLILAGIAPLLTATPTADYIGLYFYLFIVTLGTIWIVALRGRRELTTAALIMIAFYSLPHLFSNTGADMGILLIFAYAFAALFFVTNTAGFLKLKDREIIPDLVTAAGNGLFLLAWILAAAQDEWKSLIISTWMIVFAVGAFLVFKITQRREPFYVYAGIGVAMLAAATSAELQGATLTIAYTIESVLISLTAYLILKNIEVAEKMSVLLIGPVVLSLNSIDSRAWRIGVVHEDFFILLILGLSLVGLGIFFLMERKKIGDKEPQQLNASLLIIGSAYIYTLLWLSLHAGMQNYSSATMISLIIYTVIGLAFYFYGLTKNKNLLRLYGGIIVGLVVGRLLLVDLWRMDMATRIILFFLIGAMLISTAFLKRKKHSTPNNNQ